MAISYKCPGCGAALSYKEGTDVLKCEYCDTEVSIKALKEIEEEKSQNSQEEFHAEREKVVREDAVENFKAFHCESCGAEIMTDDHTAATFCGFCGNPALVEERLVGEKRPAILIPFKINKQQAIEKYRSWTKQGILTPREFSSTQILEKVTGMYVPYWLYDYDANVSMGAHGTKVNVTRKGDTEYIYTRHYDIQRNITAEFNKVPQDASEKMVDSVMEQIEPFDYKEITPFEMPYLSGFFAEKYNYTGEQLKPQVEERVSKFATDMARGTINGYSSVNVTYANTNLAEIDMVYAMLPVWMLNYTYKGKNYLLTMNGQTGKMVGKLPISPLRAFVAWGISSIVLFIILLVIGGML